MNIGDIDTRQQEKSVRCEHRGDEENPRHAMEEIAGKDSRIGNGRMIVLTIICVGMFRVPSY